MELNTQNWKEFNISRTPKQSGLLSIVQCKCGCAGDLEEGNDICYIGAKKSDNGVMKHVKRIESMVSKGNCIMLICDGQGSVGYSNYMKDDFIGSMTTSVGYDEEINQLRAMFIVTCLDLNKYKYSYGRKYRPSLNTAIIKLPVQHNSDGTILKDATLKYSKEGFIPDWQFMEKYIKSLHYQPVTTKIKLSNVKTLDIDNWKEFVVGRILNCSTTILSIKNVLDEGDVPFVSRTAENNGCDGYVSVDSAFITKGNCLTVGAEGIYSFYQPKDFATGNKVYTLRNDNLNIYQYMFLSTILNKEDYKYSYGRARIKSKLEEEIIKLPIKRNPDKTPFVDDDCTYSDEGYVPDWEFMEEYIKSLPYSDRIV